MATAAVVRPSQALRQRREIARPSLAKTASRINTTDSSMEPAAKRRKMEPEPSVRDDEYIKRKHRGKPPSLIIHLHPTFFRFDGQEGSFAYDSPMKFVIEHLRNQTVPHEMLEELLAQNVTFYDGCLIVEVHNRRDSNAKSNNHSESANGGDSVKFSMHNYSSYVTPSPLAPYPAKAKSAAASSNVDSSAQADKDSTDMPAPEQKRKQAQGPKIVTLVLHTTPLTLHTEMRLLSQTPYAEVARSKRAGRDGATPGSAQPPTPSLVAPPSPVTTRGPFSQAQKMALEEGDMDAFEAEVTICTETPLYLEPASTPEDSERVLDLLAHPLHCAKPPSSKTRKRTTAEMAADDAQAQESERRMLIMDERIKLSAGGTSANDSNQGAAASLGFSRFKTLEAIKQKHEENERQKKEDEARAAGEKRQMEEQMAQQKQMQNVRQRELHMQQQQSQARQAQSRQAQAQMQAAQLAQQHQQQTNHAHPQATPTMPQGGFNPPQIMAQHSSPVVRQQTPMTQSSPMMPQNSFPMNPTASSQGAGSPPRPTSAAMQHPQIAMARNTSQQQNRSVVNTPNMPQGTPAISQVVPVNRQMTATPHMQNSPLAAQTPHVNHNTAHMPTPQMNNMSQLTSHQINMLQQQNQMRRQGQAMSPEQIAQASHMQEQQQRQRQLLAQQNNPQLQAQMAQRNRQILHQRQQQQAMATAQMNNSNNAGSPMPNLQMQPTPQMNHAHPNIQQNLQNMQNMPPHTPGGQHPNPELLAAQQQNIAMQQAMRARAQQAQLQSSQQIQMLLRQHGGQIPQHIMQQLNPQQQQQLMMQQQSMRARQQAALRAQQVQQAGHIGGGGGQEVVPGGQPNQQYMQNLQHQRQVLAQMQQGGGGMQMMGQQFNQGNLDDKFAAMQNALNQQNRGMGGGQ